MSVSACLGATAARKLELMRVRCRLEHVATVLPGGHYYDGPRYQFEVETFCCEDMRRAWDAGIISLDETPVVALAEMTVERTINPRAVSYGGAFYPIRFCPFCGAGVSVEAGS